MVDTSEATATTGKSISIRNVTKIYGEGSANEFEALKPVSMEIEPGEFVSIVGPSGCGKSTLMLMVAGLLSRSSGDIEIGGRSVTKAFTDIGIAFQDHLLLDFRTALDNVLLQADIRHLDKGCCATGLSTCSNSSTWSRRWTSTRGRCPAECGSACRWFARLCMSRRS